MKTVPYSEIRGKLGDLDDVLFVGKGFISTAIMWFCSIVRLRFFRDWLGKKRRYSHIGSIRIMTAGLVVMLYEAGRIDRATACRWAGKCGKPFLFESTTMDIGTETFNGVRLVPFDEVVEAYKGTIVIRQWVEPLTCGQRKADDGFIVEKYHMPYEKDPLELIGAGTPWQLGGANESDFICAELNVARKREVGVWAPKRQSNEYSPQDFATGGPVDKELPGKRGEEIEIVKEA